MCTFAYHGPVISVRLVHFGIGFPSDLCFEPVGDSEWWLLALAIPDGSRLEYKLEVVDSFGTRLVEDPLNAVGGVPSVRSQLGVRGIRATSSPTGPCPTRRVAAGQLVEFELDSAALQRRTAASVYLPAGFSGCRDRRAHPLLVVHDGSDYLRYAAATTVLDNLIGRGDMPPTVVAFIHPGERLVEYADDPRHAAFITSELVPALEAAFPLVDDPAGRCLMGASFGAVASLSTAWRAPRQFGRLLFQSGSFAGAGEGCQRRPEPLWQPVRRFVRAFLAEPIAGRRPGVRELRDVRVADLREPRHRARARADGDERPLRGEPRRSQLGELARQPRPRPALAVLLIRSVV